MTLKTIPTEPLQREVEACARKLRLTNREFIAVACIFLARCTKLETEDAAHVLSLATEIFGPRE